MLPIASPFDTYRAGLWVLRKNPDLALGAVALLAVFDPAVLESPDVGRAGAGTPGLGLIFYTVQVFVPAALIFAFHATFLSDGRARGFAAIREVEALFFVALRSIVIVFVALIPTLAFFRVYESLIEGQIPWFQSAPGDDGLDLGFLVLTLASYGFGLGVTLILFGLRIPEIVDKRDGGRLFESTRRGVRQRGRMALNLAAGPGLFFCGFLAIWWGLVVSPPDEPSRATGDPGAFAVTILYAVVYVVAAAMTAGVLSDAYRRALAQEKSRRSPVAG